MINRLGDFCDIKKIINAKTLEKTEQKKIKHISTDTRKINIGDIFLALQGEANDGHKYVENAFALGASCAIVNIKFDTKEIKGNFLLVEDTLMAYQQLAHAYRLSFPNLKVIGITGSNGKTTTKDMLFTAIKKQTNSICTLENYNNEIGVPLTLFGLEEETRVAIIEMGMRGLKEIDLLAKIASPNIGIVVNAGVSHMELLGSEKNIAMAKGELFDNISIQGCCIVNNDNKWSSFFADRCCGKIITFGIEHHANIFAKNIREETHAIKATVSVFGEQEELFLPIPGRHNLLNSLAALGAVYELGLSVGFAVEALTQLTLSKNRLSIMKGLNNCDIIDDSYNANPDSMRESLKVMMNYQGKKQIAVLGGMRELGCIEKEKHEQLGNYIQQLGIAELITIGDLGNLIAIGALNSGMKNVHMFQTWEAALGLLKPMLDNNTVVLIKASRAIGLDRIVERIKE
ncbi:MAG: UDP-N-acetylmuramoyl-tripeptide--D-alanyl-D-alanine ligase [Clostridia bacterium]